MITIPHLQIEIDQLNERIYQPSTMVCINAALQKLKKLMRVLT